jgi:hypothetical protein
MIARRVFSSYPRRLHIRSREALAFKQKRLSFGFRQRVGEAISKIQFGGVAAGFPEVAIGLWRAMRACASVTGSIAI